MRKTFILQKCTLIWKIKFNWSTKNSYLSHPAPKWTEKTSLMDLLHLLNEDMKVASRTIRTTLTAKFRSHFISFYARQILIHPTQLFCIHPSAKTARTKSTAQLITSSHPTLMKLLSSILMNASFPSWYSIVTCLPRQLSNWLRTSTSAIRTSWARHDWGRHAPPRSLKRIKILV